MKNRTLVIGTYEITEQEYVCPEPGPTQVQVATAMTGICRSDIGLYTGEFGPLPFTMHGHEGVGTVINKGQDVTDVNIGDFVATRGEPAFADTYNASARQYIKIPELSPKYIIEPVACGINLLRHTITTVSHIKHRPKILIIGSGFLAQVVYQSIALLNIDVYSVSVVGRHNLNRWHEKFGHKIVPDIPKEEFDIIIDLSASASSFDSLAVNGVLILAAGKHPASAQTFENVLWKCGTIVCPSPRSPHFHSSMRSAVEWIAAGKLVVDGMWTTEYDRDTEWQRAFTDGVNRAGNYSRGYLRWK